MKFCLFQAYSVISNQYRILYSVNFSSVYYRFVQQEHRIQEPNHHYSSQLKGFHAYPSTCIPLLDWTSEIPWFKQLCCLNSFGEPHWLPDGIHIPHSLHRKSWRSGHTQFSSSFQRSPPPHNLSILKFQWPENTTTVSAVEILAEAL